MSQNIEHIEAKLCAYVDGLLDDQEAAEIERYLAANPAHQRLIEQLKQVKAYVGELPVEKAPAGLNESLESQLERSVLLSEETPADAHVILRIRPWTRGLAAAAIVVMAAALGFVVYSILPRDTKPLTLAPQRPQPEAERATIAMADKKPDELDAMLRRDVPATKLVEAEKPREVVEELARKELAFAEPDSRLARSLSALNKLGMPDGWCEALEAAAAPLPADAGLFVVVTSDVEQARQQLLGFLSANNINWSAKQELADESRLNEAAAVAMGPAAGEGGALAKDVRARRQDRDAFKGAASPGQASSDAEPARQGGGAGGGGAAPGAAMREAAMQPEPAAGLVAVDRRSATAPAPSVVPATVPPAGDAPAIANRSVIVARGLSAAQVEQLTVTLNQQQRAQVMALRDGSVAKRHEARVPSPAASADPRPGAPFAGRDDKAWSGMRAAPTAPSTAPAPKPTGDGSVASGNPLPADDLRDSAEGKTRDGPAGGKALDDADAKSAYAREKSKADAEDRSRIQEGRFDCVIVVQDFVPADRQRAGQGALARPVAVDPATTTTAPASRAVGTD